MTSELKEIGLLSQIQKQIPGLDVLLQQRQTPLFFQMIKI